VQFSVFLLFVPWFIIKCYCCLHYPLLVSEACHGMKNISCVVYVVPDSDPSLTRSFTSLASDHSKRCKIPECALNVLFALLRRQVTVRRGDNQIACTYQLHQENPELPYFVTPSFLEHPLPILRGRGKQLPCECRQE